MADRGLLERFPLCQGGTLQHCPSVKNTTLKLFDQTLDHFSWAQTGKNNTTFKQRYFVNTQFFKKKAPIFFYFGNEDDVELYVNHTGIMWEAARPFNAALVFAEHRFYGKSLPFAPNTPGCMQFLTTEQAMADFAQLIYAIRDEWDAWDSKIIGFGGSYGGMIASWFRMKYPNAVDGVLAASAPIWSFVGLDPPYDYGTFMATVTEDASNAGGASDACAANVKRTFQRLAAAAKTQQGRKVVAKGFNLCSIPRDQVDVDKVHSWFESPWGTMAMGDYPYASTYLMHGKALLPPWPVREACKPLSAPLLEDIQLFTAARQAASIFHNASGDAGPCYNITGQSSSGRHDIFSSEKFAPVPEKFADEHILAAKLQPRFHAATRQTMRSAVSYSA